MDFFEKFRNLLPPVTLSSIEFHRASAMNQHLVRLLGSAAILGFMTVSCTTALAQNKTAVACRDEWRANKTDNQAKGITEKAYVAQCRAGGAAAQPAPAPAPAAQRSPAGAQDKTATQCREEWRANKADNQAKGITQKPSVAECRGGGVATQTAPAPSPPAAGPKTTAAPAPSRARTTGAAPT